MKKSMIIIIFLSAVIFHYDEDTSRLICCETNHTSSGKCIEMQFEEDSIVILEKVEFTDSIFITNVNYELHASQENSTRIWKPPVNS